jgi:hypothetical protein
MMHWGGRKTIDQGLLISKANTPLFQYSIIPCGRAPLLQQITLRDNGVPPKLRKLRLPILWRHRFRIAPTFSIRFYGWESQMANE